MPSVSPLRCNQTTGLSTATFRDCRSVSFSVLAAMATAAHRAAITVSAVTLKHSKPHYQPDSHAAPSESLWKSNNPARRRETQPETEWNEQAQAVQLSPDEKTLPQLVEKKSCLLLFVSFEFCCQRWISVHLFQTRGVLESFKAGDSNYADRLRLM